MKRSWKREGGISEVMLEEVKGERQGREGRIEIGGGEKVF